MECETFLCGGKNQKEVEMELNRLEKKEDEGEFQEEERLRKIALQEEFWKLTLCNESLAKTKIKS